jgi:hypothetical protein
LLVDSTVPFLNQQIESILDHLTNELTMGWQIIYNLIQAKLALVIQLL